MSNSIDIKLYFKDSIVQLEIENSAMLGIVSVSKENMLFLLSLKITQTKLSLKAVKDCDRNSTRIAELEAELKKYTELEASLTENNT